MHRFNFLRPKTEAWALGTSRVLICLIKTLYVSLCGRDWDHSLKANIRLDLNIAHGFSKVNWMIVANDVWHGPPDPLVDLVPPVLTPWPQPCSTGPVSNVSNGSVHSYWQENISGSTFNIVPWKLKDRRVDRSAIGNICIQRSHTLTSIQKWKTFREKWGFYPMTMRYSVDIWLNFIRLSIHTTERGVFQPLISVQTFKNHISHGLNQCRV